ncbi:MAG: urea ABC transporter permease subunit UrtB [Spirochaetales bacterium]|jgi:urea transport system permease protein|nr:urea ABC transporter permease subunit UrtB [Spirochaetales bacterium]
MEVFVTQLINGLSLASIYLLIALGLNITFGMMGITNFAHGEFLMLGAYSSHILQSLLPAMPGGAYFLSIPLAFAVAGFAGWIAERLLIRRLYGNPYGSILATWGLSLMLQEFARNVFGASNVDVMTPELLKGGIMAFGIQIPYARVFIFCVAFAILAGMAWLLNRSRTGRQIQAVMQLRPMAGCMGINTRRIDTLTFVFGSGLAGVAGSMVALLGSIGPSTGQNYIVDSFLVVVLGGVGSLAGTLSGALMMGFASPYLEYFTSASIGKVLLFVLIIFFLNNRPEGMIPRRTRSLD